eukprot:c20492_g1_i1 orf=293-991(+)
MAAHHRPLFVLFGASMTEFSFQPGGWGAALTDLYSRKADILLRGFRGWNTRRALAVLEQFFPKNSPTQPALVVVFFGANDASFPMPSGRGQHVPIQEFKENLQHIASYLKGLSETTRVILVTAPPIYEEGRLNDTRKKWGEKAGDFVDRTNERAKKYAEACIAVSMELDVGVVDLWTTIQQKEKWQTECLRSIPCCSLHSTFSVSFLLLGTLLNSDRNFGYAILPTLMNELI